ncbi:MAG: cupin domain-containing protein [Bacteroidales bacterium]|jgi:transcriptional regulator with XRE-family HTH domain|nr:cupin domain-containing protein [Bacteroidales bacterium]MBR4350496.1 cupin domain-containing protein [Bacteroidales bacterium]MBR6265203.1 cupin domain-containing protein [Bacteroidales bacterium]
MREQTEEIAERIVAAREACGYSMEDAAKKLGINKYEYQDYESGHIDIPVSSILKIASLYNVDVKMLLTGEDPTEHNFSVTRKGEGVSVERHKRYKYQALASDFVGKKANFFIVTVDASDENVQFSSHEGQEFLYVLDGTMEVHFKDEKVVLREGDSVFFNSSISHAVRTVDGARARFLSVLV